jgi:hypothetical protein
MKGIRIAVVFGILIFAWVIWSTRYEFLTWHTRKADSFAMRINRYTQEVEVYVPNEKGEVKWTRFEDLPKPK